MVCTILSILFSNYAIFVLLTFPTLFYRNLPYPILFYGILFYPMISHHDIPMIYLWYLTIFIYEVYPIFSFHSLHTIVIS